MSELVVKVLEWVTWNSMIGGYVKWEEGVEFDRWLSEIG